MFSCPLKGDTAEGECKADDPSVSITQPPPDSITHEHSITIEGEITPPTSGTVSLSVSAYDYVATIFPPGLFRVQGVILPDGDSQIDIVANADDGSFIGVASLHITYIRPSDSSGYVDSLTGGDIEVTNQESDIYGAIIQVPPGSATRSFASAIIYDPEHVPIMPFGYIQIGPPVVFTPEGENFSSPVLLSIPMDTALIPAPFDSTHAQVLGLIGNRWNAVGSTIVFTDRLLSFEVNSLDASSFVAVVEVPLQAGQVKIETTPESATIYIDGADSGFVTPALINDIDLGEHVAKIFLPGFNELHIPFNSTSQGAIIKQTLNYPSEPMPIIVIEGSLDGFATSSSFVEIIAYASFDGEVLDGGVGVISANGKDTTQEINEGEIRGFVSLSLGHNHIHVRANGPNGSTGISPPAIITRITSDGSTNAISLSDPAPVNNEEKGQKNGFRGLQVSSYYQQTRISPPVTLRDNGLERSLRKLQLTTEIVVTLSWNTAGTDIDLHVSTLDGNWFAQR